MKHQETTVQVEPVMRVSDSLTKGFWSRMLDYLRPAPRAPTPPRLGRVVLHTIRCVGCNEPLEHGQLVVTVDGELADGTTFPFTGHAPCMVLVRKPDGTTEGTAHKHSIFLTDSEWERWKTTGETPDGAVRLFGMTDHALGRLVSGR